MKSTFARSADEMRTIIRPESAIEKPTPINTNRTGSSPLLLLYERIYIKQAVSNASDKNQQAEPYKQKNQRQEGKQKECGNGKTPAPELIPMIPGSA